ncbi:MAG: zinc ribbon domain-containing protein [Ruminococcus sp.]|nr:zinc ribbon domain-containing protein [Ruminococcus sp.]
MFCKYCGNSLYDGEKFCQNCGAATDLGNDIRNVEENTNNHNLSTEQLDVPAILCLCATAVFFISCLLTWASVPVHGVSVSVKLLDGFESDGVFVVLLSALALMFALKRKYVGFVTVGILSVLMAVFEWSSFDDNKVYIVKGSGYYVLMIGAVSMLVSGIHAYRVSKNAK